MDKVNKLLSSGPWVVIGLAVLAAGIFFGIRYILEKRRKPKIMNGGVNAPNNLPPPEVKPKVAVEKYERVNVIGGRKNGEVIIPNAEIVDPLAPSIGLYRFEPLEGKDYGRVINVDGRDMYTLRIRPEDGALEPLYHTTTMDHPTSEVYRAIHTKDKCREVFGNNDDESDKLRLGLLVAAGLIALFLMFMAVADKGD